MDDAAAARFSASRSGNYASLGDSRCTTPLFATATTPPVSAFAYGRAATAHAWVRIPELRDDRGEGNKKAQHPSLRCGVRAGAAKLGPRATEGGADTILWQSDSIADLAIGLPLQVVHPHHIGFIVV